ncbi:hypothetical protein [Streptomyces sp. NPDC088727]|uniref:hypothetical protein n=1 Tax=Streptomyces sp. NPDC088727 TaxID=3365875 RepID=UPI00381D6417
MDERDYGLSMRTSRRARAEAKNDGLRSLRVHRLRDSVKAVLRLPLKSNLATADTANAYNVYCEPCDAWFTLPEWGEEVRCPKDGCGQLYALEFAVFSAIQG